MIQFGSVVLVILLLHQPNKKKKMLILRIPRNREKTNSLILRIPIFLTPYDAVYEEVLRAWVPRNNGVMKLGLAWWSWYFRGYFVQFQWIGLHQNQITPIRYPSAIVFENQNYNTLTLIENPMPMGPFYFSIKTFLFKLGIENGPWDYYWFTDNTGNK